MLLIAWLTSQGHLCQAANNGQEALAAAENETFDLILMDVNMPILDGLEATRRLRAQPSPNRNAVVVIVSASARPQDHDIAFAAGADDYLSKPVDFSALAEILGRKCALYEKRVRPAA
jgi:CheY-like chemotaxis protein